MFGHFFKKLDLQLYISVRLGYFILWIWNNINCIQGIISEAIYYETDTTTHIDRDRRSAAAVDGLKKRLKHDLRRFTTKIFVYFQTLLLDTFTF